MFKHSIRCGIGPIGHRRAAIFDITGQTPLMLTIINFQVVPLVAGY